MRVRRVFAGSIVLVSVVVAAGCSSSDKQESSTTTTTAKPSSTTTVKPSSTTTVKPTSPTTTGAVGGNVLPPVVLTPSQTSTTVKVGTVVTFNMGDPGQGKYVATSDNTAVFTVDSEGETRGTATYNAGGKAVGKGKAKVSVSYTGSVNGVGTPTTFEITVD